MQKKNWNFGADSLDCGPILDNLEINPYVCTTVLNYTVHNIMAISVVEFHVQGYKI